MVTNYIKKGQILDRPAECPSPVFQIMEGCWDITPDERPLALAISSLLSSFDVEPYRGKYAASTTKAGGNE